MVRQGLGVLGVDDQDGHPGGGTQDARLRDLGAQDGVDERGLARARGATDHDNGGDVRVRQAGQDVVAYLGDQAGPGTTCGLDPGSGQTEVEVIQVTGGVREHVHELAAAQ